MNTEVPAPRQPAGRPALPLPALDASSTRSRKQPAPPMAPRSPRGEVRATPQGQSHPRGLLVPRRDGALVEKPGPGATPGAQGGGVSRPPLAPCDAVALRGSHGLSFDPRHRWGWVSNRTSLPT